MLREKHKEYISIISIILSILFVISSIFFTNNKTISTMATEIEEVLDKNKVTKINIEIEENNWNSLIENALDEEYVNANITIDNEKFYNVGIRAKGNSSLTSVANNPDSDRFSFKVDFSEYVDGQTYHGIEKLALNNMISDPTYLKEYISYDIYKFLGIATPEYSYADISINGESWGLYLALEVMEERFIEKNYGELEGNLYKPESMEMGGNKGGNGERPNGEKPVEPKGERMENFEKWENIEPPNNIENPDLSFGEGRDEFTNKGNNKSMPNENVESDNETSKNLENNLGEVNTNNKNTNKLDQQNMGDEKSNLQGKGPMGGRNSNGGDLKYIDENPESYSAIKDNIIFKSTTEKDFSKVIEMIKNLNNGENLEKYLNVDEILRYFAVNIFLVNLDSYSGGMYHNYYLYEKDGVFEILPWDLNLSFGAFGVNDSSSAVNFPIDNPVKGNLENAPLINELLKVDEYKERYHNYLSKIVSEYVNSGTFENTVLKLDKLIGNYVKTDKTAFYTYEQYKQSIPELITFTKERASSVKAQLAGEQPTTEYGNIKSTVNMKLLGDMGHGGGNKGAMKEDNTINNDIERNPNNNNNENNSPAPNKSDSDGNIPNPEGEGNIINDQNSNKEFNEANRPNRDDKMLNIKNNYGKSNSKIYYLSLLFIIVPLIFSIRYVTKFKRKR